MAALLLLHDIDKLQKIDKLIQPVRRGDGADALPELPLGIQRVVLYFVVTLACLLILLLNLGKYLAKPVGLLF